MGSKTPKGVHERLKLREGVGYASGWYTFQQRLKKNVLLYYNGLSDILIVEHHPNEHISHQYYILGGTKIREYEDRYGDTELRFEHKHPHGYAVPVDEYGEALFDIKPIKRVRV